LPLRGGGQISKNFAIHQNLKWKDLAACSFGSVKGFVVLSRQVICASAFQLITTKNIVISFRNCSIAAKVFRFMFLQTVLAGVPTCRSTRCCLPLIRGCDEQDV